MAEVAPQTHYAGARRMPFKKIGPNRYTSPSGKTWTKRQVNTYYATNGFKKPVRKKRKA